MRTKAPCEIEQALPSSREETDTEAKHRQEEEAAHASSNDDSLTEDVIVSQSALHRPVWFLQPVVWASLDCAFVVIAALFDDA